VSTASCNGDSAQYVGSAGVGICTRRFNLTDNIERLEFGNRHRNLGISEVFGAKSPCQLLLELGLRQPGRLNGSGQRQRDEAARIDLVVATERSFAIDGYADL